MLLGRGAVSGKYACARDCRVCVLEQFGPIDAITMGMALPRHHPAAWSLWGADELIMARAGLTSMESPIVDLHYVNHDSLRNGLLCRTSGRPADAAQAAPRRDEGIARSVTFAKTLCRRQSARSRHISSSTSN